MAINSDEYSCKLVNDILMASSQVQVRTIIDDAMNKCYANNWEIPAFVDRMIGLLELFSPMDKTALQWTCIKMAKLYFNRFRSMYEKAALPGTQ